MAKIDIITLTGLTAVDGSIVASGATVKFEAIFFIGVNTIEIRPRVYRSRELLESGYDYVKTKELLTDFRLDIPDEEYYVITPALLYEKVKDYLNNLFGMDAFDVVIEY